MTLALCRSLPKPNRPTARTRARTHVRAHTCVCMHALVHIRTHARTQPRTHARTHPPCVHHPPPFSEYRCVVHYCRCHALRPAPPTILVAVRHMPGHRHWVCARIGVCDRSWNPLPALVVHKRHFRRMFNIMFRLMLRIMFKIIFTTVYVQHHV